MKNGVKEFPPYQEVLQRCWTAYKLLHGLPMTGIDQECPEVMPFQVLWVQRAEINTITLFLIRKRHFPSPEEFEDEAAGELLLQTKAKLNERGWDLIWSPGTGYEVRNPKGLIFSLAGPPARPHPLAGVE